jgi:two-component system NtrC family sensor kinase
MLASRFSLGLGAKLTALLLTAMVVIFGLLGFLTIRLHRQHLEATTLLGAERISEAIKRNTTEYMLRNDREGLHHSINTIASQPGMIRVRIFDREGQISYSSTASEINRTVNKDAEACYMCHSNNEPLAKLDRPDRFRVYRENGERVLAVITPIENQPNCSNAACHAHPASQQILGVLDTHLSLARADQQLAEGTKSMLAYDLAAVIAIGIMSWILIRCMIDLPLRQLQAGTRKLREGQLGYQIHLRAHDQMGDLADSFNSMSLQLRAANEQLKAWAHTLEKRVDQKTRELLRAHDEMLHVETMATVGRMAAVVAHEINNPLSGILTYSKLLKKWIDNDQAGAEKRDEALQCLNLISSESRRCGDLVKNLLSFSRHTPINIESTDINKIIQQCWMLLRHNFEIASVQLHQQLNEALPKLQCDGSQIEQVLLAVMVNAADAMPNGGNIWLETRLSQDGKQVSIFVSDDGSGIPPDILPRIFEPFVTTKDNAHGTGLGLAVSRSIVERHSGTISIESQLGKGTTVTITLPIPGPPPQVEEAVVAGVDLKAR